jgi:hypothetical protein
MGDDVRGRYLRMADSAPSPWYRDESVVVPDMQRWTFRAKRKREYRWLLNPTRRSPQYLEGRSALGAISRKRLNRNVSV